MANYSPEKITVALTTFNRWLFTEQCLASLYRFTDPKVEIIVMDNGSTDGSIDKILKFVAEQKQKLNLTFVDNKENLGIARAVNLAFERGSGDLLIKLDNDIVLRQGWVFYLWQVYKYFGKKFATCCLEIRSLEDKPLIPRSETKGRVEKIGNILFEHTPVVNGAVMAVSRDYWSKNKFPDDRIYGHEDARLAVRAYHSGFVCGQLRSHNTGAIHLQREDLYRQYDLWKLNILHGKPYNFKQDVYCIPQEQGAIIEVKKKSK